MLCECIRIVDTAMKERMDERTKAVFFQIFVKELPWSRVKDENGNSLNHNQINRAKEKAVAAVAGELELYSRCERLEDDDGQD